MLGIIDVEDDGVEDTPNQGNQSTNNQGDKSSGSFTWVFILLGGIGAVAGVIVLIKLKKRVRAA